MREKSFVFGSASLRATYLASGRHLISASPIDARQNVPDIGIIRHP
jgi:hypothetical protein